jgi:hypothetical protein
MLDQVVAIVDDDVVMASELRERVPDVTETIAARGVEMPPEDVLIRETLDRLILESIQLQMGARFGVRIADAQLDAAMNRVAAQNRLNLEQFRVALEQRGALLPRDARGHSPGNDHPAGAAGQRQPAHTDQRPGDRQLPGHGRGPEARTARVPHRARPAAHRIRYRRRDERRPPASYSQRWTASAPVSASRRDCIERR